MPRIHITAFNVPADAIDENGHVNNREYLRWMQEIAVAHSAAQGWPMARYLDTGATWVVRSHFVEYLLPAFKDDALELLTWVTTMRSSSSRRRYLFRRARDRRAVAKAETLWVFVDLGTGRARRIPDELRNAFELVEDEEVLGAVGHRP